MPQIDRLEPHAPLPEGRFIAVLRRFDEDGPRQVMVEMVVASGSGAETTSRPQRPDGSFMSYEDALEAALRLAAQQGLDRVQAIDRTAGPTERDILAHGGDHGARPDAQDMDLEDGEHGPDMRAGR